jgi:hypothetical protein
MKYNLDPHISPFLASNPRHQLSVVIKIHHQFERRPHFLFSPGFVWSAPPNEDCLTLFPEAHSAMAFLGAHRALLRGRSQSLSARDRPLRWIRISDPPPPVVPRALRNAFGPLRFSSVRADRIVLPDRGDGLRTRLLEVVFKALSCGAQRVPPRLCRGPSRRSFPRHLLRRGYRNGHSAIGRNPRVHARPSIVRPLLRYPSVYIAMAPSVIIKSHNGNSEPKGPKKIRSAVKLICGHHSERRFDVWRCAEVCLGCDESALCVVHSRPQLEHAHQVCVIVHSRPLSRCAGGSDGAEARRLTKFMRLKHERGRRQWRASVA